MTNTIYKITWKMISPQGESLVRSYGPLGGSKIAPYADLNAEHWIDVERFDTSPWQQFNALVESSKKPDPGIKDVRLFQVTNLEELKLKEVTR